MKKIAGNLLKALSFAMLFAFTITMFTGDPQLGMAAFGVSIGGAGLLSLSSFHFGSVAFTTVSWLDNDGIFQKLDGDGIKALKTEETPAYFKAMHEHSLGLAKSASEVAKAQEENIKSINEQLKDFDIDAVKTELAKFGVDLKAFKEAGITKDEENSILKFVKENAIEERLKAKNGGFEEIKITPQDLLSNTKVATVMSVNGTALPSTTNIIGANGFSNMVGNYFDSNIGMVPKPMNFILPLVSVITAPGTESIYWDERQNEEGDAQFIGEGDLKPLIDGEWITKKEDIKEVAVRWKMTTRLLKHAPSVVNNFREHADELTDQKIDTEVLLGDGIGDNLTGLATAAAAFVVPPQLALFYRDANIFDAICAVAVSVDLANFTADTVVLNTVFKATMKSIKNTQGDYIIPPFVTADGNTVAGLRVIFSNKMPDDKILVGDLKKFKVVFAEDVEFAEGFEMDDFSKNKVSFKLEAFLGTYIKTTDAGSIIYDDIATVLTAIDDPLL